VISTYSFESVEVTGSTSSVIMSSKETTPFSSSVELEALSFSMSLEEMEILPLSIEVIWIPIESITEMSSSNIVDMILCSYSGQYAFKPDQKKLNHNRNLTL
jgi:hypothetical protein